MATVIKDMEYPDRYAKVTADGKLETTATITTGDLEIGAVEIKNATTDDRAYVDTSGRLHVYDEAAGGATAIHSGQVSVSTPGTAVPLTATSTLVSIVTIKANSANVGAVYVGDSSVTSTTGLVLSAGESVDVKIDDINKIYIDAANSGDGVSYIGG